MNEFCTNCGGRRTNAASFCTNCGAPQDGVGDGPHSTPTVQQQVSTEAASDVPIATLQAPAHKRIPWLIYLAAGAAAALAVGTGILIANHPGTAQSATPARSTSSPSAVLSTVTAEPTTTPSTTTHPVPALPKPGRTGPSLTMRTQGNAVNGLFTQTAPARQLVISALADIDSCRATRATQGELNQAVDARTSVLSQLAALQLSALPHSARLRAAFQAAESASVEADQHYLNWSENVYYYCTGQAVHDSEYETASAASQAATAAKNRFIGLWNPIAASLHLAARTSLEL